MLVGIYFIVMTIVIAKILSILHKNKTNFLIEYINQNINKDEKILIYGFCNDTIINICSLFISFFIYAIFCGFYGRTTKFQDIEILFLILLFVCLILLLNYIINKKLMEIIVLTDKSILFTSRKSKKNNYIKESIDISEILSVKYSPFIFDELIIKIQNQSEKSFDNLTNLKEISQYFNH